MDRIKKNALLFIIVSFILVFVILFIALFIFHSSKINEQTLFVSSFKTSLAFNRALRALLSLLPPIIIFLFVTSFSVFFTLSPFQKESFAYNSVAVPSFAMLIVFLIIVIFSELFFIPSLYKKESIIEYRSIKAYKTLLYAKELYNRRDYDRTLSILDLYFEIDEQNKEAQKLYTSAMDNISKISLSLEQEDARAETTPQEPRSYYEKGKEEYENENYYAALFYLERALKLHRDNREIKELFERSRKKAHDQLGEITRKERETKRLIQQKEKALTALDNNQLYEAYSIFYSLNKKYPDLEDINLYLHTVTEQLLKIDFLTQELTEHEWLPSIENIVFIDRRGFSNSVGRVIPADGDFYFYDITRYRIGDKGIEMQKAKYGKWMEDKILIKNNEGFEPTTEGEEELHYIYPFVHPGYLLYINDPEETGNQLTIYERLSLSDDLRRSGLPIDGRLVYLSKKLGILFSTWVLSLFLSGLGWRRRSVYEFPPPLKLIIFSVVTPFIVYLLHLMYVDE